MPARKPSVLFVSHKANRSGAPALLVEVIKAFRQQSNIPVRILSMEEGPMTKEFAALGKTYIWKTGSGNQLPQPFGIGALVSRLSQIIRGAAILFRVRDSSLVLFNTIANGHMQKKLARFPARHIYYVHELETAIRMLTNDEERKTIFGRTSLFLSVSQAVGINLAHNHAVSEDKVRTVATPVHTACRSKKDHAAFVRSFRETHGIHSGTVVGVLGGNEWRKGFDFFMPLALLYFRLYPEAETFFVWKGVRPDDYLALQNLYDYGRCNRKDKIILLPHGNDSLEHMAAYDVHLLLSREDPYPLVVLEAASFGTPTVCFENSGGATEFVGDDCGFAVPYGDMFVMAERLHTLATDAGLRGRMGAAAQDKVMRKHDHGVTIKAITDVIEANA